MTANDLVAYAKELLEQKTVYMWGGIARPVASGYISQLAGYYPTQYPAERQALLRSLVGGGYIGVDCVGLVKSCYWGGKGSPNYSASTDCNAGTMYTLASVKGAISTLPETPGLVLYCRTYPHIGVYIGDGWVIESTLGSRGDGVVKTRLGAFSWEHWFECPYISYENVETPADSPTITENAVSFKTGSSVLFTGGSIYASSTAEKPSATRTSAHCTITATRKNAPHPYHLRSTNEAALVYGWANAEDVTAVFRAGDRVKITGAYAASSQSKAAAHTKAVGSTAYITQILAGCAFPYRIGGRSGDISTANTIGFAAEGGLELV